PGCTGRSQVIVRGQLNKDGRLTVVEVFRGNLDAKKQIVLRNGAALFSELNSVSKQAGPVEVVAFLGTWGARNADWDWGPVCGQTGVVRLVRDEVYAYLHSAAGLKETATIDRHPGYTRASFLAAVRRAVNIEKERQRLLALPASVKRMEQIVRLLRTLN